MGMAEELSNIVRTLDGIVSGAIGSASQHPTSEMLGIAIYELTEQTYAKIAATPSVLQTVLKPGQMVELHSHTFEAWYFTDGVAELVTPGEPRIALPDYAAIHVAPETVHGWSSVYAGKQQGVISHFHVGHGVHKIELVH